MAVSSSPEPLAIGAPFRISILAVREQATSPSKQETPAEKMPQAVPVVKRATPVQKKVVVKKTAAQLVRNTVVDMQTEAPANATEASRAMTAQTTSLLHAQIQQAFRLQFYYPRLAVRQGWQGEVRLGMKVAANGRLEDIHILVSSGYGILDRAALESLGKVVQLPAATVLLHGQDLALELPVQYRLL